MSEQTWPPWIRPLNPDWGSAAEETRSASSGGHSPRRAQGASGSQSTRSRVPGRWPGRGDCARSREAWPGTCSPRARPVASLGQPRATV